MNDDLTVEAGFTTICRWCNRNRAPAINILIMEYFSIR
ncbi:Uncharacterised protein [Vibrio cholerae]|nr:Uncharacterised protein [Vibrio cholerae]CSI74109.1 Uncharacterised protein [Vibrio cholerae]